jgi:rhamnulokinase
VPAEDLYGITGVQVMPINTVFQLLAEEGGAALAGAARIALVPDLVAHWLGGELANERTAASTTGLLDASRGEWARGLIAQLGLPDRIFGDLVEPGTALGERDGATIYAVAGHDTASAYVAAPVRDEHTAILSSGTWSLLGLELEAPVLTEAAREANFSNEQGVAGTTRLLKNVMGLWLEQECARVWDADHGELFAASAGMPGDVPLFDPDDEAFLAGGDMPALIAAACGRTGQRVPRDRADVVKAILVSLACKYRFVLERLERVTGRDVRTVHVIGGGARVAPLCELTADLTGRQVLAGPVEATALGNILMQLRAAGELGSLEDMRAVARAGAEPVAYEPRPGGDATYGRFLDVTGLEEPAHA